MPVFKMQASSIRDRVEPVARSLEDTAAAAESMGLGLHPEGGHVAVLRHMARSIRHDAINGSMSHRYEFMPGGVDVDEAARIAHRYHQRSDMDQPNSVYRNILHARAM
jgi:hypothetical protein